ncbi:MAG: DUF167 domain-containing protein [Dehalococcoidales bacterium]|nr:DUF167 domain-containing protein [Dehalococcoidales bacterium]
MVKNEPCTLHVRIQPGASQNKVVSYENGVLKLRIAAPPVEGKANRKTIEFLADLLNVPPSTIKIKTGLTGKQKTVIISSLSAERLNGLLPDLAK